MILRTGDIIKFGRVPFKVKENSVQEGAISPSSEWMDSEEDEEDSSQDEKNLTDLDSLDLARDYINMAKDDETSVRS